MIQKVLKVIAALVVLAGVITNFLKQIDQSSELKQLWNYSEANDTNAQNAAAAAGVPTTRPNWENPRVTP